MIRFAYAAARGALAGTRATFPMTAWFAGAKKLGLLGEAPPKKITRRFLDAIGLKSKTNKTERDVVTMAAHLGFGAGMGAIYGLLREAHLWPRGMLGGAAFGSVVWGASYMGWVPALSIMPRPSHDRPGRPTAMLTAHWVFGVSLARTYAR